ncbi:MAG TPA: phosphotransferase [Ornithinimicrobium sp.]|uniref:phosphotransferase n=1 Tax=Ornithinimicrobium sp. TaxID=1977084 RepID=UPI002B468E21|nr:phosphotransferase [Ornithinimicrobium sp.]HKJ13144.1 phosphotransferase [Ornithinimicrobium sp.]
MTRSDLALAAIACAAVPGMRPATVQEVRRGTHAEPPSHQSAIIEDETGRTWVVRVPLTAAAGAELERNEALVGQLGKHLPFKVPAAAGFASLGRNMGRAAVYPHVEGSALNLHRVPGGPGLASAVGRAVAAVHNIPVELFEEHEVPSFDAEAHRERCVAELDRAAATGLVPTGLLARWEQALDAPALWSFAATAVHGSLDGWAFLVAFSDDDAATGRVVALTHWDNASVTDPAQDFSTLADQLTPPALDSVLESYSLARSSRPDAYLLNRARLAAEMRLIAGLAHASASGADDVVRSRVDELRKLDRLTSADSSLVPQTSAGSAATVTAVEPSASPEPQPTEAAEEPTVSGGAQEDVTVAGVDEDEDDDAPQDAVEVEAGESQFVRVGGDVEEDPSDVHDADDPPDEPDADDSPWQEHDQTEILPTVRPDQTPSDSAGKPRS